MNTITKLNDPQVRQLVMSLLGSVKKGASANQPTGGNVSGLLDNLSSHGLSDQVKSWISTGENKPVSPKQITEALGAQRVATAAQQAGMTPEQAAASLSAVLPQLVDAATPAGKMPPADDVQAAFAKLFNGPTSSAR